MLDLAVILGVKPEKIYQRLVDYEIGMFYTWNTKDIFISIKYDGCFCGARKINGEVKIFTRNGKEILSFNHLKPELAPFLNDENEVLFEAYREGLPQNKISGAMRNTKKQRPDIKAYIHSTIINKDGEDIVIPTYMDSKQLGATQFTDNIYLIHHVRATNEQQIIDSFKNVTTAGGEGIVINVGNKYERGAVANMYKYKSSMTVDVEIIDTYENKSDKLFKGMLGGVVVSFNGKHVNVGSGFTKEQRKNLTKEQLCGRIIEVECLGLTEYGLLREPVFKQFRDDLIKEELRC